MDEKVKLLDIEPGQHFLYEGTEYIRGSYHLGNEIFCWNMTLYREVELDYDLMCNEL